MVKELEIVISHEGKKKILLSEGEISLKCPRCGIELKINLFLLYCFNSLTLTNSLNPPQRINWMNSLKNPFILN